MVSDPSFVSQENYSAPSWLGKGVFKVFAFFEGEIAAQKDHWFLWWPVFLAVGVGFYFGLHSEPPFFLGFGALLVSFFGLVLGYRFARGRYILFALFFSGFWFRARAN